MDSQYIGTRTRTAIRCGCAVDTCIQTRPAVPARWAALRAVRPAAARRPRARAAKRTRYPPVPLVDVIILAQTEPRLAPTPQPAAMPPTSPCHLRAAPRGVAGGDGGGGRSAAAALRRLPACTCYLCTSATAAVTIAAAMDAVPDATTYQRAARVCCFPIFDARATPNLYQCAVLSVGHATRTHVKTKADGS